MDDGLKQRLIGAIVLLALAVIFVPMIFEREELEPVDRRSQIPPAPGIEPIKIPEPVVPEDYAAAPPLEEVFMPQASAEAEAEGDSAVVEPRLDERGVPEAWVLQVASFKSADRAEELHRQLKRDGYTAFTRQVRGSQGDMTRVFVGPKLDRQRLAREQDQIEEAYGLTTLILDFAP